MVLLASILLLGISTWLLWARGIKPSLVLLLVYSMYGLVFGLVNQFDLSKFDLEMMTLEAYGQTIFFTSNELGVSQSPPSEVLVIFLLISLSLGMVAALNRPSSDQQGLNHKIVLAPNTARNHKASSLSPLVYLGIGLWTWALMITSHFFTVEWSLFAHFTDYQELKHPEGLGLDALPLRITHFIIKLVGPFVFAVGILKFNSARLICLMLIVLSLYPFTFNLLTSSRLVVLYPAVIAFFALTRGNKSILTASLFAILVLSTYVVVRRNAPEMGYLTMSISEFFDIIRILNVAVVGFAVNFFDFLFQIATVSQRSSDWPTLYKILSFSPLPSAIDGFREIASDELRVNEFVPYSAWAEAFFFGPAFFIAYLGVAMIFVYLADRVVLFSNWGIRYMIVLWVLLLNQFMVQYPIRNSFRFVLLSVILFSVAIFFKRRHDRGSRYQKRLVNVPRLN